MLQTSFGNISIYKNYIKRKDIMDCGFNTSFLTSRMKSPDDFIYHNKCVYISKQFLYKKFAANKSYFNKTQVEINKLKFLVETGCINNNINNIDDKLKTIFPGIVKDKPEKKLYLYKNKLIIVPKEKPTYNLDYRQYYIDGYLVEDLDLFNQDVDSALQMIRQKVIAEFPELIRVISHDKITYVHENDIRLFLKYKKPRHLKYKIGDTVIDGESYVKLNDLKKYKKKFDFSILINGSV